jgi:NYN domain
VNENSTVAGLFLLADFIIVFVTCSTPRRNQKETLDKKLIADVLTFAWDSAVRNDNSKPCVVLLTSDGDYAYTVSKLRDRGVMSVVMHGSDNSVAAVLKASADISLSFEKEVLASVLQNNSSNGKMNGSNHSHHKPSSPTDTARMLCQVVSQDVAKDPTRGIWMLGSKVAVSFRAAFLQQTGTASMDKEEFKTIYRNSRELAVKNGWILHGRRALQGRDAGQIVTPPDDGKQNNSKYYSLEDFMTVTPKGKQELENAVAQTSIPAAAEVTEQFSNAPAHLFIKNVPTSCRIKDLVQYLEQEHSVVVISGYTAKKGPHFPFMFACIQVEDEQMGGRLCTLAEAKRLKVNNRTLEVSIAHTLKPYSGPREHYYERKISKTSTPTETQHIASDSAAAAATTNTDKSTKLFLKNVPLCKVNELVGFLEQEHGVQILRASIHKGHPKSTFQFASVEVASQLGADKLLQLSGSSELKLCNRVLGVDVDTSGKPYKGSINDPEQFYECPLEKKPRKEDVLSLCHIIRSQLVKQDRQPGNEALPDGWFDGGQIAVCFHTSQGAQGSEQGKERFKNARAEAIDKTYIEVGRRPKQSSRDAIEAVGWNCDAKRYGGEIYIRLTKQGLAFTETESTSTGIVVKTSNTNKSTVNLFVVGLPAETDVRSFVSFLETTHNCGIRRAALDAMNPTSCSAHVELTNSQDTSRMLELASDGSGICFLNRRLRLTPDLRIPSFVGTDLTRFYVASSEHPIPATIVSVSHPNDSCSVSTGDNLFSETQSQLSTEDSQLDCVPDVEDELLLCRVLYEQCNASSDTDLSRWKATGSVGSDFQKILQYHVLKGTSGEVKQRFKVARENGISQGLVEMGRRDLRSPTKEVVLVPFYSYGSGSTLTNLSAESYLRLTMKGILEGEKVPSLTKSKTKMNKNVVLTNLPPNTEILDLVKYLEHSFNITIRRASVDARHSMAKVASAHIEFQTGKDYAILASAKRGKRLVYGGMAVRLQPDRSIPNWTSLDARYYYERQVMNDDEALRKEGNKDTVNSSMDTARISEDSSETDANFETTNLLFGDNLAMLYAQGAPRGSNHIYDIDFVREALTNDSRSADDTERTSFSTHTTGSPLDEATSLILPLTDPTYEPRGEAQANVPQNNATQPGPLAPIESALWSPLQGAYSSANVPDLLWS